MNDLTGTYTVWVSRGQRALGAIANAVRWVPSSWMPITELVAVAITAPILAVLVAWLGTALGLPLMLSLAAATILALVPVLPFMLRSMQYSTPRKSVDTLFIAPTLPAPGVKSSSETQDYEGWSGPMENSTSLNDLTGDQLELISELLGAYVEGEDLTQPEWASAQSAMEIVDNRLEEL